MTRLFPFTTNITMPKGIFPHMNIPDIITALGGWGLSVSTDQLTHPTADFVEGVYCACLQQVSGLTYDSLRDPVTNSISSLALENEVRVFTYDKLLSI